MVSIYQKWSKEGTVVSWQQGHGWPGLTDAHGERRLAHVVQINRKATVTEIAKEVNAGSDRKVSEYTGYTDTQNTRIAVCCIWGCIAADQSGCPCLPLSTTKSSNNGHVSIRTVLFLWIKFSFTSRGWPGACVLLTWGTHCKKMLYGSQCQLAARGRDFGPAPRIILNSGIAWWKSMFLYLLIFKSNKRKAFWKVDCAIACLQSKITIKLLLSLNNFYWFPCSFFHNVKIILALALRTIAVSQ